MYKEGDHIRIMVKNTAYIMHQTVIIFMSLSGLTAAAGISVRVVYLDQGCGDQAVHHDFPEDSPPDIHILYRPGHYDVLYCLSKSKAMSELSWYSILDVVIFIPSQVHDMIVTMGYDQL